LGFGKRKGLSVAHPNTPATSNSFQFVTDFEIWHENRFARSRLRELSLAIVSETGQHNAV
jgi:hypothetical protein